jgi:hypothetical protein
MLRRRRPALLPDIVAIDGGLEVVVQVPHAIDVLHCSSAGKPLAGESHWRPGMPRWRPTRHAPRIDIDIHDERGVRWVGAGP